MASEAQALEQRETETDLPGGKSKREAGEGGLESQPRRAPRPGPETRDRNQACLEGTREGLEAGSGEGSLAF